MKEILVKKIEKNLHLCQCNEVRYNTAFFKIQIENFQDLKIF